MKKRILSLLLILVLMLPIVSMSAFATGSYKADWAYWYQGQSSYTLMKTNGSIMVAQAKLLAEAGLINPLSFTPDDYLAWCRSSGCVSSNGIFELKGTGSAMVAYASNKGSSVKLAATIKLSVLTPQEKTDVLKSLIGAGYYIILGDELHQAYVPRSLSLTSGNVMVSESSALQTTGLVFKFTGKAGGSQGEPEYENAYVYSVGKKVTLPVTLFVSVSASAIEESSATLNAKCVYAGDTPSSVGYYISNSRFNMRKGSSIDFPTSTDSEDPLSVSYSITGLTPGTVYYYRLYTVADGKEYSSEVMQFKTAGETPEGSTTFGGAFSGLFTDLMNTIRSFLAKVFSFLPFI